MAKRRGHGRPPRRPTAAAPAGPARPRSAPLTEQGYAEGVLYGWPEEHEHTPELRWPHSIEVYDRMRRQDAQVMSVLRAVTLPIRRTGWRMDPNGARDEVVQLCADSLGVPIAGQDPPPLPRTRDRFSWGDHLRLALTMLPFGHCVDTETEALTQRGWLRGDELREGDLLLTLNPSTGLSQWQPCEAVHRFDGPQPVRSLQARSHSSVTTLNHRWITRDHTSGRLRFRTSAELNTNDRIIRAAPSADLPTVATWSDAFVELVAWYWTDGHEVREAGAALWQSLTKNPHHVQRIRATLTTLFGPAHQSLAHGHGAPLHGWREAVTTGGINNTQIAYFYLDKSAAAELRAVAPGRVVGPEFVAGLTASQLRLFVETSIDGNGTRTGGTRRDRVSLTQKNPVQLDAFEMACSLLGIPWTRSPVRAGGWVTTVGTAQTEIRPVMAARRADGRASDQVTVTDRVWCPQVANRTWYARRRGTAYFTGNSYFEQVYRIDPDGRARLRKLGWRPPRTIARIDVAADGGLLAIEQQSLDGTPARMEVNRLVAYVHEREGGQWLGQSLLRSAYKFWLLKDRLLRVQVQTVDRNGMGVPVYTASQQPTVGLTPDEQRIRGEAEIATGLKIARGFRSGDSAGAAIPYGAQMALLGVQGTLPDADPVIRYYDEQIARAVLAHFLNLGTETGSWALGSTFANFFVESLQALAQDIADVTTAHVVEDLVDVNWGPDEPAPRLVFDQIGSQRDATDSAIKTLIDCGALTPDERLEKFVRTAYGLPPADKATARTRTPTAPAPAGAAPGGTDATG